MPNHVYNNIEVEEKYASKLEAISKVGLAQYFKPRPKAYDDTISPMPKKKDDPSKPKPTDWSKRPRLVNPNDTSVDLDLRARSYMHVNCAHCHQFGAGGTAKFDLHLSKSLDQINALDERPMQGSFGIHDAHIISKGNPYNSVLFYRMSKLGPGHMPFIGSSVPDRRGLRLIHDWILQLDQQGAAR